MQLALSSHSATSHCLREEGKKLPSQGFFATQFGQSDALLGIWKWEAMERPHFCFFSWHVWWWMCWAAFRGLVTSPGGVERQGEGCLVFGQCGFSRCSNYSRCSEACVSTAVLLVSHLLDGEGGGSLGGPVWWCAGPHLGSQGIACFSSPSKDFCKHLVSFSAKCSQSGFCSLHLNPD